MMWFVTLVLSHAVPSVYVGLVKVVKRDLGPLGGRYWFRVEPHHEVYWTRFQEMYPHFSRVAYDYGAVGYSLMTGWLCPEFPSKEDLIGWLADTLGLTQGERKLLRLSVGV
ncbi:MAG: hypothetical protein DRP09_19805 [Candidatus Thorarchaeota archaeon]|nr:MAG: hypothetical protein DRP09_19805 [Candidatus Thorarchaeota archaeon]